LIPYPTLRYYEAPTIKHLSDQYGAYSDFTENLKSIAIREAEEYKGDDASNRNVLALFQALRAHQAKHQLAGWITSERHFQHAALVGRQTERLALFIALDDAAVSRSRLFPLHQSFTSA